MSDPIEAARFRDWINRTGRAIPAAWLYRFAGVNPASAWAAIKRGQVKTVDYLAADGRTIRLVTINEARRYTRQTAKKKSLV